jgi:hypothetical protein
MGHAIPVRTDYTRRPSSPDCPASERCCAGATAASDCGCARRRLAGGGGQDWWHGSSDPAGLGDPVQLAGTGRPHQYPFSRSAAQAQRHAQGLSRSNRGRGSDPSDPWRGLSVGRHNLSRPQEAGLLAYKRPVQGIQAECRSHGGIQKTSPSVWRKSARHSHPAHR